MSDELSPPRFDSDHYERPTHRWICGWTAQGKPCRLGPDAAGRCRATFECAPALERKPGEPKGRFLCTRPRPFGGPCNDGPLPDGTCGRPIPPCTPARNLRAKRGALTMAMITLTIAALLVALSGRWRLDIANPGPLSSAHAGAIFARQSRGIDPAGGQCIACHPAAPGSLIDWFQAALTATPSPVAIAAFAQTSPVDMTSVDQACQSCHLDHYLHQPSVERHLSCLACHREHQGEESLAAGAALQCAFCHNDAEIMSASAHKARMLSADALDLGPSGGRQPFRAPRPDGGYTRVFESFETGHPEFQLRAAALRETNSLRFNHRRHLAADVPAVNGRALDCVSCHQPDASGKYNLPVRFQAHCAGCHRLQIDSDNPRLEIPHGDPIAARSFVRSLPVQYEELARREKNLVNQADIEAFVRDQLTRLHLRVASVEQLEAEVFFGTRPSAPFNGCAYCHEVAAPRDGVPVVTRPVAPDRWFGHSSFDHARHQALDCRGCHPAAESTRTADILMPSKANCVSCHSSSGGIASACTTCHRYHRHTAATPGDARR